MNQKQENNQIIRTDLRKLVQESDPKFSGNEIRCECPVCKQLGYHYEKKKLFIKDDYSVGYCFRCGTKFINKIDFSNMSCNFDFNILTPHKKEYKEEAIDVSYYDNAKSFDVNGVKYLGSRRKWLSDNYKLLGFKFMYDRLIIPFFKNGDRNGDVVFYQCRFYDPEKSGKRYFIPPSTNKPIYLPPIASKTSDTMILCEGPFGAIAISNTYPNYRCGAVMGSNISDYQLFLLENMKINRFILYFDNDDINKKARKILSERFPFVKFISVTSPKGDPEDDLVYGVVPKIDVNNEISGLGDNLNKFIEKQSLGLDNRSFYEKKPYKGNQIWFNS